MKSRELIAAVRALNGLNCVGGDVVEVNTVPTQNSDTQNSDIFQNSDTLFALTKMSLFWQEEDFGKKIH